jgi:glycosyltransferase involved in cell wall biosynthesis
MTHVCFVGYGIYPPWNEGRKVISRNIIDALKQHTDLDVSVVSSVGKGYERKKGVEYANSTWLTSYTKGYDPLLDAAMIKLISSINKQKRIDIIHLFTTHFPVFSFYGKRIGIPVVAQFFGNPHLNKLKRLRVPRAIDRYITTSIETGWFADLGITNSQNVNPPINTDTFKPEAKLKARRYFNLPADKFIVLYMGNMSEVRFSPNLLSETKFLRDPNNLLLIAANLIDSYWQNNNLLHKENIILKKGILNEKEKAMLYNTADAFILPFDTKLKSYKHVFVIDPPITMLEAMSCGVPVIAPDVFSIPKIIKDGYNGYVTSLGDFGMIDDVLYHLSKEKVEEASINARNTILNEFSYEKTALKMKRIYEGILNG